MTNPVFLGRNLFFWCKNCNIPITSSNRCGICNQKTRKVEITPPFNVRPALHDGLKILKNEIDSTYGNHTSSIFDRKIILFNRAPYLDILDEVIIDGKVIGKLRFNPKLLKWQFNPTIEGAIRIYSVHNKYPKWIIVDDGAEPYIRKGANVLAPGIVNYDQKIEIGDFIFVLNQRKDLLGIAKSRYSAKNIGDIKKGEIAKSYQYIKKMRNYRIPEGGQDWEIVIESNSFILDKLVERSRKIMRKALSRFPDAPVIISFSGGKDSLCALLTAKQELENFLIIFIDTGLEFPETIEYTKSIIHKLDLDSKFLIIKPEEDFWTLLSKFGMPTRDHRWCNRILKLACMEKFISDHYDHEEILTVLGSRKRESRSRYREKIISKNKNIPNQVNVNIIHNWSTFQVWLYLMREKLEFNPIYKNNFNRVGCWMCPSNKLGELKTIESTHPDLYAKLWKYLEKYRKRIGADKDFIRYGLWRWRNHSAGMRKLARKLKISLDLDYSYFEEFHW
ncbi:MAG: phosphoadenosine phosphosulfate reductase family protein [Candidatus Lokiarchaeota archaeon]|nr:phosphoadenosine phosphosulfate reductase family protein [Candidatus Lokiarchaeota archaeon]